MTCYEELVARGLIAQVTDEAEIREMVTTERQPSISGLIPLRTVCMWGISWRSA